MERKEFAAKLLGNSFDDTWRGKAIDAIVKTGKAEQIGRASCRERV